ncbi:MAG: acetoin:2,6-dichlorophenolindophenol oxidoreductase subunit beta [Tepidanaerobacteraceae bacterium]|nr:acetoin:2,6-dichlorophenolindophenol oxidoreductase subunit beta [Tepidanaerobacteraceae bacterium]
MAKMSYIEAIKETQRAEMQRDPNVFIAGEDVGVMGSAFGQTAGLLKEFGPQRVVDTPISESAIIGLGVGAAAMGLRPILVIDFIDFMAVCMDEVLNQASKLRYMLGGQVKIPLVIRTQIGAGIGAAAQHSQSLEAFFTHMPGMKTVAAATPADIKGLLTAAIRDDNPVMFIEHKTLARLEGDVPEGDYVIPIGKADIKRKGSDVTILSWSAMVHKCLAAAESLAQEGINAEVIDIRSLVPLDKECILNSLGKTGRLVIVHEAVETSGYGAEIAAMVADQGFDLLDAPIKRVAAPFTPVPFSPVLEKEWVVSEEKIIDAVKSLF